MQYNMDFLTLADVQQLIADGDDSYPCQIRVTNGGQVFLSTDVATEKLVGIRFRFETFDAHHDYVGPDAAKDINYIKQIYTTLVARWRSGYSGYVDIWEH